MVRFSNLILLISLIFSFAELRAQEIPEQPSIYLRVLERFNSGYLPDLSKVDTSKGIAGRWISISEPNKISDNVQLICDSKGDEFLGVVLFCGPFKIFKDVDSKEKFTIERLKGDLIEDNYPLSKSTDGKTIENFIRGREGYCNSRIFWREVKLDSGARVLIVKSVTDDETNGCDKKYKETGFSLSYFYLTGSDEDAGSSL